MSLKARIENKKAHIGVLGLGYVGLPLAVEFAKAGFPVTGIDVDESKVAGINSGAGSVIAPMIENAEQMEGIMQACCWPPMGRRGVGFSRANLFGKYFEKYNVEAQDPLLIAQIEHINAVNNLEKFSKYKD